MAKDANTPKQPGAKKAVPPRGAAAKRAAAPTSPLSKGKAPPDDIAQDASLPGATRSGDPALSVPLSAVSVPGGASPDASSPGAPSPATPAPGIAAPPPGSKQQDPPIQGSAAKGATLPEQASFRMADPGMVSRTMADVAERGHRIVTDFLNRQNQATGENGKPGPDPMQLGSAFLDMATRLASNPARLVQAQLGFWQDYLTLWQNTARRMWGEEVQPVIAEDSKDRRFKDEAWRESEVFDFIKQSYLLSSRYFTNVVQSADDLEPKTAQKIDFYTRQFVDAMSPSNFVMTNPEVLRKTAETGGENLLRGLQNLLSDLERGKGKLKIRMTDDSKFKIGENIAVSPGKVVFQNELMQLIQYSPTTETVLKQPLLIMPPWINKFYILDLRPKNSFVRWAVAQGHTVFVISWVNPDEKLADKSFEDYMLEGPYAALDAIEKATGEKSVNAVGYCLGGTLLAATLARMAERKETRINSATFFTTMVDFEEAGELAVFIDEEQLKSVEDRMQKRGYLEGREMATTFNMLRANDLIWSFVVQNYLLGQEAFPFDLLYWNDDSTRMPAAMHSFYLRRMYQANDLVKPGGITLAGTELDLRKIKLPTYILSTREDHIAPWKSTYRATQLYAGPVRFVLAASGHIAGVTNPPEAGKYSHWVASSLPASPDEWFTGATELAGSWWPDWHRWVLALDKEQVPARVPGEGGLPAIEAAPGSYVKVTATD